MEGKPYDRQIKPFNFCIVGVGNFTDPDTGEVIKPLAPFRKDAQVCAYEDFIDYNSDKMLKGQHYWKKFSGVVRDYANHREAKFDGSKGILTRKHIRVSSVVHIGKESNDLEVSEVLGVNDDTTLAYSSISQKMSENKERIIATPPSRVRQFGIIKETWLRIQRLLKAGRIPTLHGKTAEAMMKFLRSDVSS
ncbi:hypothetical protein [Candidatus Nitrososphaera evergladensis]|nr:hypothetical protein [Candidatus Nitrososphaera evergladensis]